MLTATRMKLSTKEDKSQHLRATSDQSSHYCGCLTASENIRRFAPRTVDFWSATTQRNA